MTLTVTALGWTFHVELSTDTGDDAGYDHDVTSTALDAEPDGDTACGFVAPGVGWEL